MCDKCKERKGIALALAITSDMFEQLKYKPNGFKTFMIVMENSLVNASGEIEGNLPIKEEKLRTLEN